MSAKNVAAYLESEGREFYKPPAVFVDALNDYSKPKWHSFANKVKVRKGKSGREYELYVTNCGTALKKGGEWATNKPTVLPALCRRCFPAKVSSGYRSKEEAEQLELEAEAKRKSGELPSNHDHISSPDMPF